MKGSQNSEFIHMGNKKWQGQPIRIRSQPHYDYEEFENQIWGGKWRVRLARGEGERWVENMLIWRRNGEENLDKMEDNSGGNVGSKG